MSRSSWISLVFLVYFGAQGCASSSSDPNTPQAALATSFTAQQAVRQIENQWNAANRAGRLALEPNILRNFELYRTDPHAVTLLHYLVWLALERRNIDAAAQLLQSEKGTPPGTSADFARVLKAAVLLRRGHTKQALAELLTVHPILIVDDHRVICDQLLIEAAITSGQVDVATHYMLDILLTAPPAQQETVRQQISMWLDSASASTLEDIYTSLIRTNTASGPSNRDTSRAVTFLVTLAKRRLLASALKEQDAALAKRILDNYVPEGDTDELARLAATDRLPARIVGRSVGVLLEIGNALQGQRSAQVAMGVSSGLDLLAAGQAENGVLLKTRTASAEAQGLELAFQQLTSDGAAVVIAGMTPTAAARAIDVAERSRVPTIILTQPDVLPTARSWSFILGESSASVSAVLDQWAKNHGLLPQISIAEGDARCLPDATSIGGFLFPIAEWKKSGFQSVLMLGSEECTEKLLGEMQRGDLSTTLLLGMDAAALYHGIPKAVTFSAGVFPLPVDKSGMQADRDSWYFALGHDAALLASVAVQDLDAVMTNQPQEVSLIHSNVLHTLQDTRIDGLWTSSGRGFNAEHKLERKLSAVQAAAR
ncbi:MAG TPA: hypothetical protein VL137_16520 [Polyangiaceae bacterium]|nr:hypothetical protein [Polyangiaceae bacterium]